MELEYNNVDVGRSIIDLTRSIEVTLSNWFIANCDKLDKEDFDRAYDRVWKTVIRVFIEYEKKVAR